MSESADKKEENGASGLHLPVVLRLIEDALARLSICRQLPVQFVVDGQKFAVVSTGARQVQTVLGECDAAPVGYVVMEFASDDLQSAAPKVTLYGDTTLYDLWIDKVKPDDQKNNILNLRAMLAKDDQG